MLIKKLQLHKADRMSKTQTINRTSLIKGCRLVSPGRDMQEAFIEMENGVITKIHESCPPQLPPAEDVFDARGLTAMPGFIDIHVHGGAGYDVTDGTVEAIERIGEAKLAQGVTTFYPTTLTLEEEKLSKAAEAVAVYMRDKPHARAGGLHLEGPFINPACAGAQNPEHIRPPDMDEVLRLNAIAPVAIVSFAIEAEGGIDFTKELRNAGIVPSCGHSSAAFSAFRDAKKAGLKHLTHFCNQLSPLDHREIGLVGAGLLDEDVLVEMICDKVHLCPDMIALAFKTISADRILLVTDAMCATGLGDGMYELGGLDVKVEAGCARLVSNGLLAGSTLTFNNALKNVYEVTALPLMELVKTTSWNQARSLGLEHTGKLEQGYRADITILDSRFDVKAVFVDGARRI